MNLQAVFGEVKKASGFGAAVLTAGLMAAVAPAHATVVYSGTVSIAVPDNIDGIYLNVVTGASGTTAVTGYDINPYSAVAGQFNLWGPTTTTWFSSTGVISGGYVLAPGTTIGPGGSYFRPGGTYNIGTAVTLNAPNYFGFQFTNESTGATNYGWVQITFGATAGIRSITGYAYDNAGLSIQTPVPEPATLALWLAGLVGVGAYANSRRRRDA